MAKRRNGAILLLMAMLAMRAAALAGDLSLGVGYPYLSAKYDFSAVSLEGRYASGAGINVYAGRGYWNFYRSDPVRGFAGLEAGAIRFNTLGLKGSGYEASLFAGGEYRLSENLSLLMDFAPTLIMLRHDVYSDVEVSGVEFVINAGVYYRFGGGGKEARRAPAPAAARPSPAAKAPPKAQAAPQPPSRADELDALVEKLNSEDWKVRRQAAFELGKTKSPEVVEVLLEVLGDENEKVRGVAAMALGNIGDKRAFIPLFSALTDRSAYVRVSGCKALGSFKDKRALKALNRRLLKDRSEEVRKAAAEAIEKIKGGDAR